MKEKLFIAGIITLTVFWLASSIINTNTSVNLQKLDIKTKQAEINDLNKQLDELFESEESNQEKIDELRDENERLQEELQAKKDAQKSANSVYAASPAPSGDWVERCLRWGEMAGVTLNDSAIKLLERESHCNPTARNPNSSAGGIPQALPWTKMGCDLSWSDEDAVCQIKWFKVYVDSRYGSFENALAHSYTHGWY